MTFRDRRPQNSNEEAPGYKNRMDSFPVPPAEIYDPPPGGDSFFGASPETARSTDHSGPED